jgi:hypothetical protein
VRSWGAYDQLVGEELPEQAASKAESAAAGLATEAVAVTEEGSGKKG